MLCERHEENDCYMCGLSDALERERADLKALRERVAELEARNEALAGDYLNVLDALSDNEKARNDLREKLAVATQGLKLIEQGGHSKAASTPSLKHIATQALKKLGVE